MNIFKSFFKSRDKPRNASVGTSWFHIGRSWSGKAVTERTALQQTAVYACVRIIAETIASLPLHLYKYTDMQREHGGFDKCRRMDADRRKKQKMNKFWNFKKVTNTADNGDITENILILNGPIAEESWWGDEVTPKLFKSELDSVDGNLTVFVNSPGGDVRSDRA